MVQKAKKQSKTTLKKASAKKTAAVPSQSTKQKVAKQGLFVPAGIFLGMGFGFLIGNVPAGLFIGLGAGFLFMALARANIITL